MALSDLCRKGSRSRYQAESTTSRVRSVRSSQVRQPGQTGKGTAAGGVAGRKEERGGGGSRVGTRRNEEGGEGIGGVEGRGTEI